MPVRKTHEYDTTFAPTHAERVNLDDMDLNGSSLKEQSAALKRAHDAWLKNIVPCEPSGVGWEMVGSTADSKYIFWFWRRTVVLAG